MNTNSSRTRRGRQARIAVIVGFALVLATGFQPLSAAKIIEATSSNTPAEFALTDANILPNLTQPVWNTNQQGTTSGLTGSEYETQLATARFLEKTGQPEQAEPILVMLLAESVPDTIRQAALLELAAAVRMRKDLPRAQAIYTQFIERWPNDPRVPEIYLRQGQLFRQMGLNSLALTKFYAVMTAAIALKNDQSNYYPNLVLEAQTEIAESHYLMGRFADAADFYSRLLKQNPAALNRPQAQFRLIRSLKSIDRNEESSTQAQDFLSRYPTAPVQPEVRFYLAQAVKQLGKNNESLQQVLLLLQEQKAKTEDHPEIWAYWQQRAGNEIANQLYREGDYIRALEVYINLAQLDDASTWQMPVKYQIGLTYERLQQPQKAVETYQEIIKIGPCLGTNATPGQIALLSMARWRAGFLGWHSTAETSTQALTQRNDTVFNSGTNFQATSASP